MKVMQTGLLGGGRQAGTCAGGNGTFFGGRKQNIFWNILRFTILDPVMTHAGLGTIFVTENPPKSQEAKRDTKIGFPQREPPTRIPDPNLDCETTLMEIFYGKL